MTTTPPQTTPKSLFALYHLGLDGQGAYRFRNLQQCARELKLDAGQLTRMLQSARIDAETLGQVEFPLSKWHVEAQFVAADAAQDLIDRAWTTYQEALQKAQLGSGKFHHSVNYDDLWGDGYDFEDDNRGNR